MQQTLTPIGRSAASAATLGFSGQTWSRAGTYALAEQKFYESAMQGEVSDQPAI